MTARARPRRAAPALTLIEVVISMAVLAIVLVSLLQGAAVSIGMQRSTAHDVAAEALARELLDWVCALPYDDPDGGAGPGLDAAEIASNRTTFDDLDDFEGWSESPPAGPDGVALSGFAAWRRAVAVENVNPADLTVLLPADDRGAKVVSVSVWRSGKLLAQLERVRYLAADGAKQ